MVNTAFAIETFLEGTRTDERRIAEMMEKGELLVEAETNIGRIVASVYTEKRGQRGYFGMLAVDPALQGTGLGRKMVEAVEEHCRKSGCKHMDIVVLSLRPELLPLYRKVGYAETAQKSYTHCATVSSRKSETLRTPKISRTSEGMARRSSS